jgi:solute carrier family 13 (sodium-dependent dicarboxylate transporter), member 2/3/5
MGPEIAVPLTMPPASAIDEPERAAERREAEWSWLPIAAGPGLFVAILAAPLPGLGPEAHRLLAIFAWTAAYWVTETLPLPVTALLSSTLCILLGVAPARTVLAAYGDPIVFLFIASFVLAEATKKTGLDRRFAFAVLRTSWASRTPGRLLLSVGVVTCVLSLWLSNTATTALMLPVAVGLLRATGHVGTPGSSSFAPGLLLMLTWSASVAVGLPIGSPPNLIALAMIRDFTPHRLTFFDWAAVAMPLTIAMLLLCWLILRASYRAPAETLDVADYAAAERTRLGRWTPSERVVLGVFLLACALWMLPGGVAMVAGPDAPVTMLLEQRLGESAVGLLAAILLFVLPGQRRPWRPVLAWHDVAGIDWGTVLLFGGSLALGRLMFETKLADALGGAMLALAGSDLWMITALAIVLGVTLSEISSNTAAASTLVPLVIAVAGTAGVSPVPPAMGAALGASFGFMLPVSTPPNAIVYGSRLVPLRAMIRSGICLDVAGAVLIWIGLRVLCPLLGLA